MKKIFCTLFFILILSSCAPAQTTPTSEPPTSTAFVPTETPIPPTPTPALVEINGGSYSQKTGYDYDAYDSSGNLAYVKDAQGNWIKASYEVPTPVDIGLSVRLETDFALNSDGTGITGVDGLDIDSSKSIATLNFDGKGEETFSTADIHVVSKDINGQPIKPTFLLAGYVWNQETGKWEIYNPGFPMDSPKDELAWFNQADIANGNWLRWHQRATAKIDMKALFANALPIGSWEFKEGLLKDKWNGVSFIVHGDQLTWSNLETMKQDPRFPGINKDQYPGHGGLTFSYLADSGCVIVSYDARNGDGTITSLPLIIDDILWTQHRNDSNFTRAAYAAGHVWDQTMAKEMIFGNMSDSPNAWVFVPVAKSYPDEIMTSSFGQKDSAILKDPAGISLRESTVSGNQIDESASLDIWGGLVTINPPPSP